LRQQTEPEEDLRHNVVIRRALPCRLDRRQEAGPTLELPLVNATAEPFEGTATDEEDVRRVDVDGLAADAALVGSHSDDDLLALQDLQQALLNAFARHVTIVARPS